MTTTSSTLIGQKAPTLPFTTTNNLFTHFHQFKGKNLVLYFYPKDDTPGCTTESMEFGTLYPEFIALDTQILGISRDNLKSHANFQCKYDLPFELISDSDSTLCQHFDVIKEKNMYGKKSFGIERSTFLIDKKGIIRQEWRKVKAPGHAAEVLAAVKNIESGPDV